MDLGLTDRVAIVSGASQGIGAVIAARLSSEGCRLALIGRRQRSLYAVAQQLTGPLASKAISVVCDVTQPDQIVSVVNHKATDTIAPPRLCLPTS